MDVSKYNTRKILETIESRFKEVANLDGDFSIIPMPYENHLQVKTDKEKSKAHGEVFTPIWVVDSMLERYSDFELRDKTQVWTDICSGYGQMTIRLLRKKYNLLGNKFDIKKHLFEMHYFSELQLSSCYKLIHIFSPKINLFIGDAKKLNSLPENCSGIYVYKNGWKDITEFVKESFSTPKRKYSQESENLFVETLQGYIDGI